MASLKNFFFKPDEPEGQDGNNVSGTNTPPAQNWNINPQQANPTPAPAQATQQTNTPAAPAPQANKDMIDKLFEFLLQHNLPGPDYLELKNNISSLTDFITDTDKQYIAAFGVLKGQYAGVTKEIILNAIDKYVALLEEERQRGLTECKEAFEKNDVSEQLRTEQMRASEITRQINEMLAEQEKVKASIQALEEKNRANKSDYDTKCATFNASVDVVTGILKHDKEKITQLNF